MSNELLPLFPLEVVLFPGMPLPLHIFEPRYKQLIRTCLERGEHFGVVLARKEGLAGVGCTTEIVKVVKEFDDGRMNILTVGRNRFRVLQLFEELPYLQAQVEMLEEDEETDGEAPRPVHLWKFFEEAFTLAGGEGPAAPEPEGGHPLSFHIAILLPLELEIKQKILELPSEMERQRALEFHLQKWLPKLRRLARLKVKAAGNGHG